MKAWIIKYCNIKICTRIILWALFVDFILFGMDFTAMLIPYAVFAALLATSLLLGLLSYIGFIIRGIYIWSELSSADRLDDGVKVFALTVALGFSAFLVFGMILPSWNYPR